MCGLVVCVSVHWCWLGVVGRYGGVGAVGAGFGGLGAYGGAGLGGFQGAYGGLGGLGGFPGAYGGAGFGGAGFGGFPGAYGGHGGCAAWLAGARGQLAARQEVRLGYSRIGSGRARAGARGAEQAFWLEAAGRAAGARCCGKRRFACSVVVRGRDPDRGDGRGR